MALCSRIIGSAYASIVLYLFIVLGISIVYLLACAYLKKVSLLFLFFGLFAYDFFSVLGGTSSIIFPIVNSLTGLELEFIQSITYGLLLPPLEECVGAYNSNIYALIALFLILLIQYVKHMTIPMICALLCSISPISTIALFPIALCYYVIAWMNQKELKNFLWALIIPILIALCAAIYFMRADNPSVTFATLRYQMNAEAYILSIVKLAFSLILLVPFVFIANKDRKLIVGSCVCLLVLASIHIGSITANNELWLKGSIIYVSILFLMIVKSWNQLKYWRIFYLSLCLIGGGAYTMKMMREFSLSNRVADRWNGHLNHDDPFLMQSVPPTKEPIIPSLIFRHSGESESCYPGKILPRATGVDYTRPASTKSFANRHEAD